MTSARTSTDERSAAIADAVGEALEGRHLLSHPFYRRWEAGELTAGELRSYATEYRTFEAALPGILSGIVDRLQADGEATAAASVGRNLEDELGRPEPHLALFDAFAAALGSTDTAGGGDRLGERDAPGAAASLVDLYVRSVEEGPVPALAALGAYETQAAAVARSKAAGLRRWYGMDDAGVAFWDVHAEMDAAHGAWAIDTMVELGADPEEVGRAARRAADAWWAFLDEREAEAPAFAARP